MDWILRGSPNQIRRLTKGSLFGTLGRGSHKPLGINDWMFSLYDFMTGLNLLDDQYTPPLQAQMSALCILPMVSLEI